MKRRQRSNFASATFTQSIAKATGKAPCPEQLATVASLSAAAAGGQAARQSTAALARERAVRPVIASSGRNAILPETAQWRNRPGVDAGRLKRDDDSKKSRHASGVPGLHRRLADDLAVRDVEHGGAEDLVSVRIGAGLREGERLAVGDSGLDAMRHRAAADIVVVGRDRRRALELARPARRTV